MNIYKYIDDYGIYSFKEKAFNDVDSIIFSFLSYANLSKIFLDRKKVTIKEAGRIQLGLDKKNEKNITAVRDANKLLKYIKDTKRYQNCLLYNYEYIGNKEIQFGAVSIEYDLNKVYVSYEGTDSLFSGWKENFMLSYQFPTISHEKAISYLNQNFLFARKKLIVGGHSKGGNLALVAAMYANTLVKSKIEKVYNMDGPGLLENEYNSQEFEKIKKKYTHIIPNYSLVGLLLNNTNTLVVESSNKGILAHDIIYWQIEGAHIKKVPLSNFSEELEKEIANWLKKFNKEDKIAFVQNLDDIIKKSNVLSILDLKRNHKNILKLISEAKEITPETKKVLVDFIAIVLKAINTTKREEIREFLIKNRLLNIR